MSDVQLDDDPAALAPSPLERPLDLLVCYAESQVMPT